MKSESKDDWSNWAWKNLIKQINANDQLIQNDCYDLDNELVNDEWQLMNFVMLMICITYRLTSR